MRRLTCVLLILAPPVAAAAAPPPGIRFEDATAGSGLAFSHFNGWSGRRYLVETMGSGVCLLDADGDGDVDAYLVQGAPTPGSAEPDPPPGNALFRNDGSGRFTDVTTRAGVGDRGQGMGCAAGDVDGDGDLDLYVVNFGANVLYRNNGDGTFADVTVEAGVGDEAWGSSAAFADADGDGDLDLYVVNYLRFRYETHRNCSLEGRPYYCSPRAYGAAPDVFYVNDGSGRFREATRAAGLYEDVDAKGLGAVFGDVDGDGDPDLFVANDSTRNFLFKNRGDGTFRDVTLLSGVGYSEAGVPQAGMGTDLGDYDNDGNLDLVVTNLSNETNQIYRNFGTGVFSDVTSESGVGGPGWLFSGFGVLWIDAEADGDLDLFVVNGHILDNVHLLSDSITYPERNHLFENLGGGRFAEISTRAGEGLAPEEVGRGLAMGDLDGDGDPDLVLTNNGGRAVVLRNASQRNGGWLQVRLRGLPPNRFAVGARVELVRGGHRQTREVGAGNSYQSHSDPTMHFALGRPPEDAMLRVRWPWGGTALYRVGRGDQVLLLRQAP